MNDIFRVMSKSWLVGFTEAEGSFFIGKNGNRMRHVFAISQKRDKIVLDAISIILNCKVYNAVNGYQIRAYNSDSIVHIINFFTDTMVGIMDLEFRI